VARPDASARRELARRLVESLAEEFPGLKHVSGLGLLSATDERVWDAARDHGLAIISKDDDFRQRSLLRGHPPKVVWLRIGNASVTEVEASLREASPAIRAFLTSGDESLLVLN